MKENYFAFKEMMDNQRKILIDAIQLYDAYIDTYRDSRSYRGGMHWKTAKGRQYLFRSMDRYGNGKSLGPRSDETEKVYTQFKQNKKEVKERLASLEMRLKEQARFCRAASIQRVPRIAASILRVLDQHKLLGRNIIVIGTHAIYAYEAAAGVILDTTLLSTADIDILWDVRPRLNLAVYDDIAKETGLIALLQKADRSFKKVEHQRFRATNKTGYMVDLVKPEPRSVKVKERRQMGGPEDLESAEVRNLQWLTSSPKFTQVVIGDDGYPATITAPDPRAFALHKLWLSEQPDREPIKKKRDRHQSFAVALLVIMHMPQYKFNPADLKMFPKRLVDEAMAEISNLDLPPGFH